MINVLLQQKSTGVKKLAKDISPGTAFFGTPNAGGASTQSPCLFICVGTQHQKPVFHRLSGAGIAVPFGYSYYFAVEYFTDYREVSLTISVD